MYGFSLTKILLLLAIIVIIFGTTRLPSAAEGLAKAIKNFRRGLAEPKEIEVKPVEKTKA